MTLNQPTLCELQRSLASLILQPTAPAQTDEIFRVPPGTSVGERLHVYAAGYPARLREALVETFPAVVHLLSDSGLNALVTRYVGACPPLSYNLNDAGARLPKFLRADELGVELPFLADLAELEWRLAGAFHAPREPGLEPAEVASIPPESWGDVVLRFQPGVAVIASDWPIHDVWSARETPIQAVDIDLAARPQVVLIYRAGLATRCELVGAEEGRVVAALVAGRTLGDALDDAAKSGPEQLAAWFSRWMQLELLAGVSAETHARPRTSKLHEIESKGST